MVLLNRGILRLFVFFMLLLPGYAAEELVVTAEAASGPSVHLILQVPLQADRGSLKLYRSTARMIPGQLDAVRYPIVAVKVEESGDGLIAVDESVAHNTAYFYLAEVKSIKDPSLPITSNQVEVFIPDVALSPLAAPELWLDKTSYCLEIRDGGRPVKRYPFILGRDPVKRKLHTDFESTPEGIYKIINRKADSFFSRALDIDYPNPVDRARYAFLKTQNGIPEGKGIGGEIQIHGQLRSRALESNWTWGCVALRNEDIKEIFDGIKVGTPVFIMGGQITSEDIALFLKGWTEDEIRAAQTALKDSGYYSGNLDGILGGQTRVAVGKFQVQNDLPVTCDLDSRTHPVLFGRLPVKKRGNSQCEAPWMDGLMAQSSKR